MKVYIGPYNSWFQPYKWLNRAVLWWYGFGNGVSADKFNYEKYDELTDWIRDRFGWLNRFEGWVDSFYKRKIKVRVDHYDVWNAEDTLGHIILPTLKLLREKKQGSPLVDDEDVPEQLRSTAAPALNEEQVNTGRTDDNWHLRWQWALDEMIWAMEQVVDGDSDSQFFTHHENIPDPDRFLGYKLDFDKDGHEKWQARKRHGLTLFGKYFEALWD